MRERMPGEPVYGICKDTRACKYRWGEICTILKKGYEKDGDCNFAKANYNEIAYNTLQRRHGK